MGAPPEAVQPVYSVVVPFYNEAETAAALIAEIGQAMAAAAGEPFTMPTVEGLLERMACYAEVQLARGERLPAITRHMLGLFQGKPGARGWRRVLSEQASRDGAGLDVIDRALAERHARAA